MPDRFVILHHTLHDGEHWDLMLESGDCLLTWQLPREPLSPAVLPLPARRIADHRKRYLDYEGPISGDRGAVRRVDAGTVTIEHSAAAGSATIDHAAAGSATIGHHAGAGSANVNHDATAEFLFVLSGRRLQGRFRLRPAADTWWFEPA